MIATATGEKVALSVLTNSGQVVLRMDIHGLATQKRGDGSLIGIELNYNGFANDCLILAIWKLRLLSQWSW